MSIQDSFKDLMSAPILWILSTISNKSLTDLLNRDNSVIMTTSPSRRASIIRDAQNDPIPTVSEEKVVTKAEATTSDIESEEIGQNESSEDAQVDTTPKRPKVARTRRGKQTNVQPVIETGSGEWDMMVRYAEFYNDNPDENRITVVLKSPCPSALRSIYAASSKWVQFS